MFERNRVEQGTGTDKKAFPVRITLEDGSNLRGRLLVARSRTINDELNHEGQFVLFEPYRGDQMLLSKSSIRSLSVTNIPKESRLEARVPGKKDFDPHAVLGVTHGARREEIRKAYLKLAKAYHPDRYASQDLPDEIIEYACAMQGRINLAYKELSEAAPLDEKNGDRRKYKRANFGEEAQPAC